MAVIRAAGIDFDVDRFRSVTNLPICQVFRRGELRFPSRKSDGRVDERSGVNIVVCETDFDNLPRQIEDTITFLAANDQQIRELGEFPGVEIMTLDFGISRRDVYVQNDLFPPELIRRAGSLGLGIELSQYPVAEPEDAVQANPL